LDDYFDSIVISGDVGCEKPERKIFRSVFTSLGVEPFECLIVGDKLDTDIKGGFEANLGITVWLPMEDDDVAKELQNASRQPDFVIKDISELPGLLGRSKKNERTKTAKNVKPNRSKVSEPRHSQGSSSTVSNSLPTLTPALPSSTSLSSANSKSDDED
jgi:N-acylneuraminate-9-phosphatase